MWLDYRSRPHSALKLCAYASIKLVHVRTITWLSMLGLIINIAQINIMTRGSVANKNHVAS